MKKFVFFFAWKEARFRFRKMALMDVDIGGHVSTRQWTSFVTT